MNDLMGESKHSTKWRIVAFYSDLELPGTLDVGVDNNSTVAKNTLILSEIMDQKDLN